MSYQYVGLKMTTETPVDNRIVRLKLSIRGNTPNKPHKFVEIGHATVYIIAGNLDSDIYLDLAGHVSAHFVSMLSYVNYEDEPRLSIAEDHWPEVRGTIAYVEMFEIHPKHKNMGLGTKAFRDILRRLRNLNVTTVFLTPFPLPQRRKGKLEKPLSTQASIERLVAFYKQFGFVEWLQPIYTQQPYMYLAFNQEGTTDTER